MMIKFIILSYIIFLSIHNVFSSLHFFLGKYKDGGLGSPVYDRNSLVPKDKWFVQDLDHFNDADTRTWKQRYFVNATFYKKGGPIFLQIGGEGSANPIWLTTGFCMNEAAKHGAIVFLLEHRYYGKSRPTEDMSTENLRWLSSEQALADLASFIGFIRHYSHLSSSKLIAFGGSYPGSLAAWLRLKYPHLVDGSVASSAPMYGVVDFQEYIGVVQKSLDTFSEKCTGNISEAFKDLEKKMASPDGRQEVVRLFRLCDSLSSPAARDVANLFSTLAGNIEGVVQYNKDNRAFEGASASNITIDTICKIMVDVTSGSAIERYAKFSSLLLDAYGEKCLDFSYSSMLKELRQISWDSSASEGGRQWTYQTCTEFGFYQSSDLEGNIFGNHFPIAFWVDMCAQIYGPSFTLELLEKGINRTNLNYGGLGIKATRIVFPNGSIDPWHALGVTSDLSSTLPAIFIEGTAHCANMYPESADDSVQLMDARQKISLYLQEWLRS